MSVGNVLLLPSASIRGLDQFGVVTYLLLDYFYTAESPPIQSPRDCEPGPGQLVFTPGPGGANYWIDGNERLRFIPSGVYDTNVATAQSSPRKPGLIFQHDVELIDSQNWLSGFSKNGSFSGINKEFCFWFHVNAFNYRHDEAGFAAAIIDYPELGAVYRCANVARDSGAFLIVSGGNRPIPTLLWVTTVTNNPDLYAGVANETHAGWMDNFVVADTGYFVAPLVNDGFNTDVSDLALHVTDGEAVAEEGGSGLSWIVEVGTFDVQANTARSTGTPPSTEPRYTATVNANAADVILECSVFQPTGWGPNAGVIIRANTPISELFYCSLASDNTINISEWNSTDNWTVRASGAFTFAFDVYYLITFIADGTELVAYAEGANRISYANATAGQTNTRCGFRAWNANTRWDNLVVWPRRLFDFPSLAPGRDPSQLNQINEEYTTPTLAPHIGAPRYMEPGPGTHTFTTEAASDYTIDENQRLLPVGLTNNWNLTRHEGSLISIAPGVIHTCDLIPHNTNTRLMALLVNNIASGAGTDWSEFPAMFVDYFNHPNQIRWILDGSIQAQIGVLSLNERVSLTAAYREQGAFLIADGGQYDQPTLLFATSRMRGTTADRDLYPRMISLYGTYESDNWQVPENITYTVTPVTSDSFDRADGPLAGTQTDNAGAPEGGAQFYVWRMLEDEYPNEILIQSNRCVAGSPTQGEHLGVVDAQTSDCLVECIVHLPAGLDGGHGQTLRATNALNLWISTIAANTNEVELWERVNGQFTRRAGASATINVDTDYTVLSVCGGQEIAVYVDGANRIAYSSATAHQNATMMGMRSARHNIQWDNFVIWPRRLTDFPDLAKTPDPDTTWLYFDRFIVDRATPLPSPRLAEYGPGNATTAVTSGSMSTAGGVLKQTGGGAWGGNIYTGLTDLPPTAGLMLAGRIKRPAAGVAPSFGWYTSQSAYFQLTTGNRLTLAGLGYNIVIGDYNDDQWQDYYTIQRTQGAHFISDDGYFSEPTLLFISTTSSLTATRFECSVYDVSSEVQYFGIPDLNWTPTPIRSDSFNRPDGPPGNTDGQGVEEGQQSSGAWLDVVAPGAIVSNTLQSSGGLSNPCVECNETDVVITTTFFLSADWSGVMCRSNGVDETNMSFLLNTDGNIYLYEYNSGQGTQRASQTAPLTINTAYYVTLVTDGDLVRGFVGLTSRISYLSYASRETKHGARLIGGYVDDFAVWERHVSDLPTLNLPQMDQLNDQFLKDAVYSDGVERICEPGPGTLTFTVQGAGAEAKIESQALELKYPDAGNNTCGWVGPALPVKKGLCAYADIKHSDAAGWVYFLSFNDSSTLIPMTFNVGQEGGLRAFVGAAGRYAVVQVAESTFDYARQIIGFRQTGAFYIRNDTLLWFDSSPRADPQYLSSHVHSRTTFNRKTVIPQHRWTPIPLISDGFGGPDGTNLAGRFTDGQGAEEGQQAARQWTVQSGQWQIQSNRAELIALVGDVYSMATIATADSDVLVEAVLQAPSGGTHGVIVRYADLNNCWLFGFSLNADNVSIFERNNGTWTQRAGAAGVGLVANTDYQLLAVADDEVITGYLDYGNRLSYSSAAQFKTTTIHGIESGATINVKFDRFNIWERRPELPEWLQS